MTDPADSAPPDLVARIDQLARSIAGLEADAAGFRRHFAHLEELERDVVRDLMTLQPARDVVNHVHSVPNETALRLSDDQGRPAMGFVSEGRGDEGTSYADFEGLYRGTRAEIQRRQRPYVSMLDRHGGHVLDLGCGRGEFLELLAQNGLNGSGVDLDAGMVAEAAAHGLDVRVADLFEELDGRPTASVATVFSAQVIEHLEPADMERLIAGACRVLTDDGLAIIETVNPHSLRALRFFWLDKTHTIPVYPESALMMARAAGFVAAVIYFPGGTGDLSTDLRESGDFALICAKSAQRLEDIGLLESRRRTRGGATPGR